MVLFAFFAAMAETERENIRDATLEGLTAAARKGIHGGRPPPVITADMLHTVLRRRANGESVEKIRPHLIIPTGKRKGPAPQPGQHLPGACRARQGADVPRGHRPSPRRLRRPPGEYLTARSSLVSQIRPEFRRLHGHPSTWRLPEWTFRSVRDGRAGLATDQCTGTTAGGR